MNTECWDARQRATSVKIPGDPDCLRSQWDGNTWNLWERICPDKPNLLSPSSARYIYRFFRRRTKKVLLQSIACPQCFFSWICQGAYTMSSSIYVESGATPKIFRFWSFLQRLGLGMGKKTIQIQVWMQVARMFLLHMGILVRAAIGLKQTGQLVQQRAF